tara:strand:+ start:570 stop:920 length:351 start_codon:yes stop_codon:yes gene_type:complete
MKLIKKDPPRKFKVGKKNILLKDYGKIYLDDNEQITFIKKKSEFDIVKKNWGYYATPSINKRLKKFNFRTYITKNFNNHINIMIVHKEKDKNFKKYLKIENMTIVKEITNGYCLKK